MKRKITYIIVPRNSKSEGEREQRDNRENSMQKVKNNRNFMYI